MKGIKTSQKLFKLGSRGVAHFVAPLLIVLLVGVVGTYMVVASHAATKKNETGGAAAPASTKEKKEKKQKAKPGYMVIYGESGRYNSAKILAVNNTDTLNCGGKLPPKNSGVIKKIPAPKKDGAVQRVKLRCTSVNGTEQYAVFFGKDKNFTGSYVGVDIDQGFCTMVHADPAQIRKVATDAKGNCPTDNDTPTKVNVTMRIDGASVAKNGKYIKGYVSVISSEPQGVTRAQCTGEVAVAYTSTKTGKSQTYHNPLKYVGDKKLNGGIPYCVATMDQNLQNAPKFLVRGEAYNISVGYPGSIYFNPALATQLITVPKS